MSCFLSFIDILLIIILFISDNYFFALNTNKSSGIIMKLLTDHKNCWLKIEKKNRKKSKSLWIKSLSIFIHSGFFLRFIFVCDNPIRTVTMRTNMMNDDVNELLLNAHQLCWMKFNHWWLVFIESSRFGALFLFLLLYNWIFLQFNSIQTGNHLSKRFIAGLHIHKCW